jgi:hypothetical protein
MILGGLLIMLNMANLMTGAMLREYGVCGADVLAMIAALYLSRNHLRYLCRKI